MVNEAIRRAGVPSRDYTAPGGESLEQLQRRVVDFFNSICRSGAEGEGTPARAHTHTLVTLKCSLSVLSCCSDYCELVDDSVTFSPCSSVSDLA